MPHVLIIHEVEAYPAWKVVFDRAADIRKHAGEIRYQLLRHDRDANSIVHFSEWSSLEQARRFFESPELVEIRKQAGVKAPEFLYLHEIERGVLYLPERTGHRTSCSLPSLPGLLHFLLNSGPNAYTLPMDNLHTPP
ncbi:MAG TPA: antibiotic biosynthesis monooxygenase [Nitrospira sp.]|jgi:quinol monooxygenase YgiN|nr:antibiotic biosynthesis monooxygenase [Nitrospira sp.]MBS0175289.1 antibiotic biosynthesis monooxygenase [Nitrospira sp.]MBX3339710.1 antibiotic biosynthesis monooxygenase [Nitrospira sp.]MCW5780326.1 antibiotic biosynthesis monooxygenase [Nitrospira sp.]HNA28204.1 antibiotic biosynthesis monooxygenase [Nitrospira sp.]